jgi:hypothetical protein
VKTTTYGDIKNLAAELAGRTRDNLPTSEATMLLAFFAMELPDVWNKEAWPELCDNLEAVDATGGVFSKREGDPDEMGDILAIFTGGDPRSTTNVIRLKNDEIAEGDGQVRIITDMSTVYVDWQTPVTDLLAIDDEDLAATELPLRFKLPLAFRGAAHLLSVEDPALANKYLSMAETELQRQASKLSPPWWRKTNNNN